MHPAIIALRNKIKKTKTTKKYNVILTYITSRGKWYFHSWKGDIKKSGGVATNIGVHFFDMLMWIFGEVKYQEVNFRGENKMSGFVELENADVKWFLSTDRNDLPKTIKNDGQTTFRSITVDEEEIEFSGGFTDLHTMVYQDILSGGGFGINAARPSINLVHDIRNAAQVKNKKNRHPFLKGGLI